MFRPTCSSRHRRKREPPARRSEQRRERQPIALYTRAPIGEARNYGMTLIAKFSVNGVPLLIGDVLVSSDAIAGRETTLPLVGDINKVIADHGLRFEVGFKQKVNSIGERLAIAWSGPMMQAERALRALSAISTRNNPTSDDIRRALEAIDRLCLIGLLHRGTVGTDVEVDHFAMGIQPIEQAGLGKVFAAGTGRAAFSNHPRTPLMSSHQRDGRGRQRLGGPT
jgi:hypothetical protein